MSRINAKKSLGQHFLRSKSAIRQIIDAAVLAKGEVVLEIGPGEGVLTDALLASGTQVIAVETDSRCITKLEERFSKEIGSGALRLIFGDIRQEAVQKEIFTKKFLGNNSYKLVANIPYYITGMLFRLFLEQLRKPIMIVFLVQKEVAEQIIARDHKEGILSLSIKIYGVPKYISKVKREAFSPPPKVDSAIIAISDISSERLKHISDETYFRIIKAGLSAKRKMLLGNLTRGLGIPKDKLSTIFTKLDIPENARGEDVSAETWLLLAEKVKIEL